MENYFNEIQDSAADIKNLVNLIDSAGIGEVSFKTQLAALKSLFGKAEIIDITDKINVCSKEAPSSFAQQWKVTRQAINQKTSDPNRAVRLLARLLGWAYIEARWRAATSSEVSFVSGSELATLAAIQLGMSLPAEELAVQALIYAHSALISELLLGRFESGVKKGLAKALVAEENIDARIKNWEAHLGAIEERTDAAEQKISSYERTIEKYRVQLGFLGLSAAYKEFGN